MKTPDLNAPLIHTLLAVCSKHQGQEYDAKAHQKLDTNPMSRVALARDAAYCLRLSSHSTPVAY